MRKRWADFLILAAALASAASFSASAAQWSTNSTGQQIYVNDNGSTVTNSWIKADSDGATIWYYAGADGTLRKDGWQRVGEDYYYFDASGKMQTGWVDNYMYYCDPQSGAMKTGWRELPLPDALTADGKAKGGSYWFYFSTKDGEKFHAGSSETVTKTIDGAVYGFDENGVMVTGWAETESTSPDIAGYMYFSEKATGSLKLGQRIAGTWYAAVGPNKEDGSGNVEWFYLKSNGHPAAGSADIYDVQRINGKRYLFNDKGNPVYGIQRGKSAEDGPDSYYYCGSSKNDCSVKTGKMTLTQDNGERISCYFESSGKGLTGVRDNSLYYNGKLQKAEKDIRYQKATLPNGTTYVVNENGRIMKNRKNYKDGNGIKWTSDASGKLVQDEGLEALELSSPEITDLS
ncbi:N-acetylmuramoyl-L-alanine amidase family protein [Oribacterium sp. oral taxon 078]|uniref:N-acetylmuramoyl-L-alanine amidase family protein n=1 Tax=Oribacterium sp. oral taxon 078 TaxID=652706 RepID=UPI0006879938|nr:cell wall-binding protein [Oribacterium sp. oral taxon 078]